MLPALIAGGGALAGGLIQAIGANSAAKKQTAAMERAMALRREMFGEAKEAWGPYTQAGGDAWSILAPLLGIGEPGGGNALTDPRFGSLTKPFEGVGLENTPDYKNALRAAQNSAAAKGLGSSGNALVMASNAADTVYGNAFDRYWKQNQSIFGELFAPYQIGAQGAGSITNAATQTGAGMATDATNIGNAQAAGTNAAYGAVASGVSGAASAGANQLMYGPLIDAQTQYMQRMGSSGASNPALRPFSGMSPGAISSSATASPLWMQSLAQGGW